MPIILSYACIYIVWGSTYYFMKMAAADLPAPTILGLRFSLAGILLFAIAALQHKQFSVLLNKKRIVNAVFLGFLLLVSGNGLVTIAVKKIDSYIAALIVATTPFAVMTFDRILWKTKVHFSSYVGAMLGIIGIAMLLYRGQSVPMLFTIDYALVLMGVLSWGLATSLSKKMEQVSDPLVSSALQSFSSGIIAIIIALCVSGPSVAAEAVAAPFSALFAIAYLAVFGGISFYAFAYLLKHEPNNRITTYAFVNPLIAVGIGLLIGKEASVPFLIPAVVFILFGLALVFYGETLVKWLKSI